MSLQPNLKLKQNIATAAATEASKTRPDYATLACNLLTGMIGYWNTDLRCQYANDAYLHWFGKSWPELHNISFATLAGEALFLKNQPYIRAVLRGEPQTFERSLIKFDQSMGHLLVQYFPDFGPDGAVQGFFSIGLDVTQLKQMQLNLSAANEELARSNLALEALSRVDALSGLSNRRHLFEQGEQELLRSKRALTPFSVLMLDIDYFKLINDSYGHDAGDKVIQALSQICHSTVREIDVVARIGGEEFVVLMPATDLVNAIEVGERLRGLIAATTVELADELADELANEFGSSRQIHFTVSIGACTSSISDTSFSKVLQRADAAMYQAKHNGRNQIWSAD